MADWNRVKEWIVEIAKSAGLSFLHLISSSRTGPEQNSSSNLVTVNVLIFAAE